MIATQRRSVPLAGLLAAVLLLEGCVVAPREPRPHAYPGPQPGRTVIVQADPDQDRRDDERDRRAWEREQREREDDRRAAEWERQRRAEEAYRAREEQRRAYEHRREQRADDDDRAPEPRRDLQLGRAPRPASPPPAVDIRIGGYFGDGQRREVQSWYRQHPRGASCPPGLARKNNGCLPPGQARRWRMGQPLPREVEYVPVEPDLRVRLGTPPAGHEFVRVASDILLIAVGTGMVIDAIQDAGR